LENRPGLMEAIYDYALIATAVFIYLRDWQLKQ
jgi:hypothetical protein